MDNRELIKQFNVSTREYLIQRTDEQLSIIQRSLQVLSASSDPTIFDLTNKDIVDFFSNLHELMFRLDINHIVMWSAVNVLLEACRNASTRERLTKTYKFSPVLTKLLKLEIGSRDKNIKVLKLLQELTYGVNISWQEAHLTALVSILTKWIVSSDEELILLSLGILVNLCHKNVPAVYTLMRTVDLKKFIKALLKLQRNNDPIRVQVCKLLIILQDVSGGVPDSEVCSYIKSTCPTLIEALHSGSACLMRHVVSFFKEIVTNPKTSHLLLNYKDFGNDIEKLLTSIKEDDLLLECVGVLFEFFRCLVKLDFPDLERFYPRMLSLALRWVTTEEISTDSLRLMCCIVSKMIVMPEEEPIVITILDILDEYITVVLLIVLQDGEPLTNDHYNKLTAVLHLLSELLKVPKLAEKIIHSVTQSGIEKLFAPLKTPILKDGNFFQEPVYTFYIQALLFLTELSDKETNWFLMYRELLRERQVQMILSIALCTGPEKIKKKVLSLTGNTGFSTECVGMLASCMNELNKLIIFSPSERTSEEHSTVTSVHCMSPMDITPLMSITQEGYLNTLIEKYENAASKSDNLMTSSLMELYQFKMASMHQTIRCMQTSQEAADLRATRLQHSLALTSSEVSRLHQLLHSSQQNVETNALEVEKFSVRTMELESQMQEMQNKYEQALHTLKSKTRIISEQNEQIDRLKEQLEKNESYVLRLKEDIKNQEEKTEELRKEKTILEDNIENLQKTISEKKKENDSNLKKISTLKKEIMAQSDMISELQRLNSEKEIEIGNLSKELQEQKRTRERILEVAMGKL